MSQTLFVPPGHFYSPLTDDEECDRHFARVENTGFSNLGGITISDAKMIETWERLLPAMRAVPFQLQVSNRHRYYWDNGFFSYGDGTVYFGFIAAYRPKRIVEVGSGFSSALALDAREHLGLSTLLTFIEPFPDVLNSLLRQGDRGAVTVLEDKVQNVDIGVFEALEAGDILFLDSSHIAKTGSDVCLELFEILPVLKPGVLVHFHDVFYPFEYPRQWVIDERRAWNEAYLLRAFLMYNSVFDIMFFNDYFGKRFPHLACDSTTPFARNCGGGLWIKRGTSAR